LNFDLAFFIFDFLFLIYPVRQPSRQSKKVKKNDLMQTHLLFLRFLSFPLVGNLSFSEGFRTSRNDSVTPNSDLEKPDTG